MNNFLRRMIQLKFAADDGSGEGGEGNNNDSGFSGEFVEKKDPVSGNMVKVPKELDSFFGHVISSTRTSVEGKYKPMIEAFESKEKGYEEIKTEYQKMKEATMSAEELAQENASKKIKEFQTKMETLEQNQDKWKGKYFETTVRNDILSSFGDTKLCNPEQTAILMQREGNARVEEIIDQNGKGTDRWKTIVTLNVKDDDGNFKTVEGEPRELFKVWINQEHNLHHQLNNLSVGGGSANSSNGRGSGVDYMSYSAEERLNRARENNNKK